MPAPTSAVLCSPWATSDDVPLAVRAELDVDTDTLDRWLLVASETLWALSGRRWSGGGCAESATLRSTPRGDFYDRSWGVCPCWGPETAWFGAHIPPPSLVRLPRTPVAAVTSITEGGLVLAPSAYLLGRTGWLERVDGAAWDVCSGTTIVSYTYGEPPPAGGVAAVVELGEQMVRRSAGLDGCRLPKRVSSVTRAGVSMAFIDPQDYLDKGRTGLPSVDLWLAAVNPHGRSQGGQVWSPDIVSARRTFP